MGRDNRRTDSIGATLAAALGGLGGVVAGGLLVRMGVKPAVAAAGVAVVGGVGVAALDRHWRDTAVGVSALGVGQLALAWLEAEFGAGTEPRNVAVVDDDDDDDDVIESRVSVEMAPEIVEFDGPVDEDEEDNELSDDLVIELARPRNAAPVWFWDKLCGWSGHLAFVAGLATIPLLLAWLWTLRARDLLT